MSILNNKNRFKTSILLIGLIISAVLIFSFFSWIMNNYAIILLIYVGIFALYAIIYKKTFNKIIKLLFELIFSPLVLLFFLLQVALPIMALMMFLMFYVIISSLFPKIILVFLENYSLLTLSSENQIFLLLSSSTIISVVFYKPLFMLIKHILKTLLDNMADRFKFEELTNYIFSLKNLKFVIYVGYLIYIMIFSMKFLDDKSLFNSQSIDLAVLQAFLVFLAFDNVIINSKEIKMSSEFVLNNLLHVFSGNKDKTKE